MNALKRITLPVVALAMIGSALFIASADAEVDNSRPRNQPEQFSQVESSKGGHSSNMSVWVGFDYTYGGDYASSMVYDQTSEYGWRECTPEDNCPQIVRKGKKWKMILQGDQTFIDGYVTYNEIKGDFYASDSWNGKPLLNKSTLYRDKHGKQKIRLRVVALGINVYDPDFEDPYAYGK